MAEINIGDHFQPTTVNPSLTAVVLRVGDTIKFEYRRQDGRRNDTNDHELPREEFLAKFRKVKSAAGG